MWDLDRLLPYWPSYSGDGEEEGKESSKSNEAKKDGDVEPKKDEGAAGILNNSLSWVMEVLARLEIISISLPKQ